YVAKAPSHRRDPKIEQETTEETERRKALCTWRSVMHQGEENSGFPACAGRGGTIRKCGNLAGGVPRKAKTSNGVAAVRMFATGWSKSGKVKWQTGKCSGKPSPAQHVQQRPGGGFGEGLVVDVHVQLDQLDVRAHPVAEALEQ